MQALVAVTAGDGIGTEVTAEAVRVLERIAARCGHSFRFESALLGGAGTILGAGLGALLLAVFIDGFAIIGISANPLLIVFGAGVVVAMIANVQLGRLREAGRT